MARQRFFFASLFLFSLQINSFSQTTFGDYFPFESGTDAAAIAIADLNNDGLNDIIQLNDDHPANGIEGEKIYIFYQKADSTFENTPVSFFYPENTQHKGGVMIRDIDNNNLLDIVVIGKGTPAIAYQESLNEFNFVSLPDIAHGISSMAVGDLNDDGLLDFTYPLNNESFFGIAFQQPGNTFQEELYSRPSSFTPNQTIVIDINNDGKDDLIFGDMAIDETLYAYLQTDMGISHTPIIHSIEHGVFTLGDIDNDGDADLITKKPFDDFLHIALFNPDSNIFEEKYILPTEYHMSDIKLKDLNCDGYLDIIATTSGWGYFTVYLGSELGYSAYTLYDTKNQSTSLHGLAVEDTNNDGFPDVHIARNNSVGLHISENLTAPTLSDYEIMDTLQFSRIEEDTFLIEELIVNEWVDTSGDCTISVTENIELITTSFENRVMISDDIYVLEASFCSATYTDSLVITKTDSLPAYSISEEILLNITFDTLVTTDIVDVSTFSDTTYAGQINVDSTFWVNENQYQSGDTIFTVIDSLLYYFIYDHYSIETTVTTTLETKMCNESTFDIQTETSYSHWNDYVTQVKDTLSQTTTWEVTNGLFDLYSTTELHLFPNPTSGQVSINIPDNLFQKPSTLQIMDLTGTSVFEESMLLNNHQIRVNISHLPEGIYLVALTQKEKRYYAMLAVQ